MNVPQPIPYQGSKRNIAKSILSFFPNDVNTLIEPFAGSAALSLAAASSRKIAKFHLNDINSALMNLWVEIINDPKKISDAYECLWNEQKGIERTFYCNIRDKFNETKEAHNFLYLLARCVKASVRYNSSGGFNQSPDNRRKGRNPIRMREDIFWASKLLFGRTTITSKNYWEILSNVSEKDIVYMDPPYQGVCSGKDPRYYASVDFDELLDHLKELVARRVSFILSYDGRKGDKKYGRDIPEGIGIHRVEINAGRSTQSTLLGKNEITYESLYLSENLLERIGLTSDKVNNKITLSKEATLALYV